MIKRSHIRQFLALVDEGSFTRAAQRLRVTQPTISAGIADLERLLGARLFQRDKGGVHVTERGGAFLPQARDLEARFRQAEAFGEDRPTSRAQLRVGVIGTVSTDMLGGVAQMLANGWECEFVENTDYELRAALNVGRIDLALTVLRPDDDEGRDSWQVLHEPYVMMACENHRLAGCRDVPPGDLAAEAMIARRSCEALRQTSRFFIRHGVRPRFAFRSANDAYCLQLVAAGLGITTAPISLIRSGMEVIDVTGYDLTRRLGILISPNASDSELLRSVLQQELETLSVLANVAQ
ncbi:LysR family transcriptional regulator [Altererythrobacter salegens]|uniref:LysR family transcriptional regulator n=1 Tax=Croceibacterium salegens TaxID=1737568 RepID=A0A6I4T3J9_9SPHN|nr:LysR family transcriptional regulator [Croceibacterium salegens]MXO61342.1 LysR family transcriptional regulator [Croceibacterium salegens]